MIVSNYCRRNVVVIEESKTPLDAAIAMRECSSGDVVVVRRDNNNDIPIGVISDRDIVIEIVGEKIDPESVTVKDMLLKPVVTVNESEDLNQCMQIMKQCALKRLPVVDDDGLLVGIISVDDVIEVLSSHINDFALLFNTPPTGP